MSSHQRQVLSPLNRLRYSGQDLSPAEYTPILEALEQAAQALHTAPRGQDPIATALWWHHERSPALAQIADALAAASGAPAQASAAAELQEQQARDRAVAMALQQSLRQPATRPVARTGNAVRMR